MIPRGEGRSICAELQSRQPGAPDHAHAEGDEEVLEENLFVPEEQRGGMPIKDERLRSCAVERALRHLGVTKKTLSERFGGGLSHREVEMCVQRDRCGQGRLGGVFGRR